MVAVPFSCPLFCPFSFPFPLPAAGNLAQDDYVTKSREYDKEIKSLTERRADLLMQIPFQKRAVIDMAIQQYCEGAKLRYKQCVDFETKRQFLLDYVEKVMFWNDRIVLHGRIPVTLDQEYKGRKVLAEPKTHEIEFRIEMKVATTAANWLKK